MFLHHVAVVEAILGVRSLCQPNTLTADSLARSCKRCRQAHSWTWDGLGSVRASRSPATACHSRAINDRPGEVDSASRWMLLYRLSYCEVTVPIRRLAHHMGVRLRLTP